MLALLGLASIAVVFGLCVHVLGGSVPEHQPAPTLGQWTGDPDYVIVEVPSTTSPFSSPPASGSTSSGNGVATR